MDEVEKVARAIAKARKQDPDQKSGGLGVPEMLMWEKYKHEAEVWLAAYRAVTS